LFTKNIHSFQTAVHRRIYIDGLRLTPIDVSLSDVDGVSEELIESCKQYYEFISNMLWDMYHDPKSYGFPAGEMEAFLDGRKLNGVKRKYPKQVNKLRSEVYNTACIYQQLLFSLAKVGQLKEDSLTLLKDEYELIKKRFDRPSTSKSKGITEGVPFSKRIEAFAKNGLLISEGKTVLITSSKYPKMLLALKELADSAAKIKTFGEENFKACEFRQIFHSYTPKFVDVIQTLDNDQIEICNAIHSYLLSIKARPSCTTYWKVNYKYKGEQILQISTEGTELKILINGVYWWENLELLNNRLIKEEVKFQKFAVKQLNYCTFCSTTHEGGGYVTILGHRARLCGGVSFRFFNPDMKDYEYLRELIDIRADIIGEVKKNKV
jgi:hypothetical protein